MISITRLNCKFTDKIIFQYFLIKIKNDEKIMIFEVDLFGLRRFGGQSHLSSK